jgi:hypothetical protein
MAELPQPAVGQVWEAKGMEFRIDFVKGGEVYYVRWTPGQAASPEKLGSAGRITVAEWTKQRRHCYFPTLANEIDLKFIIAQIGNVGRVKGYGEDGNGEVVAMAGFLVVS